MTSPRSHDQHKQVSQVSITNRTTRNYHRKARMSTLSKTVNKMLTKSEVQENLIMAEARVEAFYDARKRSHSTKPVPARIEVLKGNIQQYQKILRAV